MAHILIIKIKLIIPKLTMSQINIVVLFKQLDFEKLEKNLISILAFAYYVLDSTPYERCFDFEMMSCAR